ncbi:MAG: hypothetical protein EXQ96_05060 [Alphaproteobacteria bacterium]|nr:hypothetical protein [Alphaproteobacteria bacterium]
MIHILFALLLVTLPAEAYHGWGSYDAEKPVTLSGPVVEMTYNNPHGTLRLETLGKTWTVTLSPPSRMQIRGLLEQAMKPGTIVTVYGYPNRVDAAEMRAERITINGVTTELR